ncbi:hypothetical protein SAMN02745975_00545 [Geosporobacter subterraneus DSM 17957]|uniref:Uncharacterized protein n=1 Tax=Geosporobacter subterraneus DSM 17957 TaxID=1121919 RepID=A0A1M6DR24_9FIRM|nr:hypothetical protein [Geosporobacter subterraneus]SHI75706.1 hypothetical protein SAMN02745975_00545 [Geosporobacter subterraneus DSM 17957]
MKVYRMDDYDWVAANSAEEAKEFYIKETGVSEEELEVEECNLKKEGMYVEVEIDDAKLMLDKIASGEKVNGRNVVKFSRGDCGLCVWITFEEVLKKDGESQPYIIASSEW